MSKKSTLSIACYAQGDGIQSNSWSPCQSPAVNANAPSSVPGAPVALVEGLNTIAVPPGSTYAVVSPELTSANQKALRPISGDTGWSFTNTMFVVTVTGMSSIYVQSAAAESLTIAWL